MDVYLPNGQPVSLPPARLRVDQAAWLIASTRPPSLTFPIRSHGGRIPYLYELLLVYAISSITEMRSAIGGDIQVLLERGQSDSPSRAIVKRLPKFILSLPSLELLPHPISPIPIKLILLSS